MDFRFPDLAASRDVQPDSVSRHRDRGDSDFAEHLDASLKDRSVDEPRDARVRDAAPREIPNARDDRNAGDERVSDIGGKKTTDVTADEGATPTEHAQQEAEPTEAPPASEAETEIPSELPAGEPASTAEAVVEQAATPVPNPAVAVPSPAPQQAPVFAAVSPTPASAPAAIPPVGDAGAPPAQAAAPAKPPVDSAAAPPQPKQPAMQPSTFEGALSAAPGKLAEPAPAPSRPQANAKTPNTAAGQAGANAAAEQNVVAAPVIEAGASSGDSGRESGNTGQRASTSPQPAHAQSSAQAPAAGESGIEQLAAIVRHGNPTAMSASARATDAAQNAPTMIEAPAPDTGISARPAVTPEPAKSDTPSRPFANVAPGLTIAAQATAQTPDQANAAERLAQLAAAKQAEGANFAADLAAQDPAAPQESAPSPTRFEQAPQTEIASQRNMAVDAASATASARSARPVFHPLVAQVATHVAQAAAEGNDRISIRLSPAELGRIDVKLEFGPEGRVQAVFAADRPQTVELLQRDARDLERALQDAGLRADSGSLSFNLRGEGRNNGSASAEKGAPDRRDSTVAEIAAPQVQAYAAGSAAPGRLDIRI